MTAPKRWYQLSMLQILVAMAVVAVLWTINAKVDRVPIYSEWEAPAPLISHYQVCAGWPFKYLDGVVVAFRFPGVEDQSAKHAPPTIVEPAIRLVPLLGNIAAGSVLLTVALLLVVKLGKQRLE